MEELIPIVKDKINSLIKKPNMSEKLLSKPPFRFLHDTISAIITTTGFADGLYTPEEMDSANINEKGAKIAYLEKIFGVVSICHGAPLEVKAAKVVAGLEPENTCQFLILLGTYAGNPNCDSQSAVRRFLGGGGASEPSKETSSSRNTVAESKDDERRQSVSKPSSRKDDSDDVKGGNIDVPKHMDQMEPSSGTERGKSRSGTRGGARQPTSNTGISGVAERPANLDAEIDKCDGSYELTKDLLGSLITKPKLSEKLLSKPPFRFLHDIIMEIIRVTRFADGLYTPEEMDSANVKEKEQKILFLEKMLKVVGVQLNTIVEAKPPKIVAGLEPQDTNRFLQLLAVAARMMPDSREAVRTAYEQLGLGIPPFTSSSGSGSQQKDDDEPKRSSEQPSQSQSSSSSQRNSSSSSRQPVAEAKDDIPSSSSLNNSSSRGGTSSSVSGDENKRDRERDRDRERERERERDRDNIGGGNMDDKPMEDASDTMDRGGDGADESKKSMRPTTARRRPPKIKESTREVTAKETAPSMKKTEGIMKDGQQDDDDDAEIVEDERLADEKFGDSDRNQGQSKLVQDILSRQAEQEAVAASKDKNKQTQILQQQQDDENKNEDKSSGIRLGRLRKTGANDKKGGTTAGGNDVERLRKAVQTLVQHTGPLGTCMDYIQEDIGIMTTELHRWEEECRKYENEVEKQQLQTQETLSPLQRELAILEDQIQEQKLKVAVTKASIAKNESRIQNILRLTATA
mmetsp:Transcript_13966/g.14568  ORF Transcript_13966/g.14568 Transcript_13966/m.14568 type:complete len:743 (+) Transcript_13966:432-2660(+)